MHNWEEVRAAHQTGKSYTSKITGQTFPTLWVERFGRRFEVVDCGQVSAHNASTFFDDEPVLGVLSEIQPGDVFVDAGAALGSYTIPALAMGARVYAFEPCEDVGEILMHNVMVNGWATRCSILKDVLFDGGPYPEPLKAYAAEAKLDISQTVALDEFFAGEAGRVDFMKLDVEGAELGLLEGASECLQAWKPTLVIEDHCGIDPGCAVSDYPASIDSSRKIHEMLAALGYSIEVVRHDATRKFIVARHYSRGTK